MTMGRKVCRPSYYSHGSMAEKLRNNFHDRGDAIRWRPTSWEEPGNRAGSACQNPCVSLRIPVKPAWGQRELVARAGLDAGDGGRDEARR